MPRNSLLSQLSLVKPLGSLDYAFRLPVTGPLPTRVKINDRLILTRLVYTTYLEFDICHDLHESQRFKFAWPSATRCQRWCHYVITLEEEQSEAGLELVLQFVHDAEPIPPLQLGSDETVVLDASRPFAELQLGNESLVVVRQHQDYFVILLVERTPPNQFMTFKQCFDKLCLFAEVPNTLSSQVIEVLSVRVPWGWNRADSHGVLRWGNLVFRFFDTNPAQLGLKLQSNAGELAPQELHDLLPLRSEQLGMFNLHGLVCNYLGRDLVMFEYGVPFSIRRGTLAMLHHSKHDTYLFVIGVKQGELSIRVDAGLVTALMTLSTFATSHYWVPSGECKCEVVELNMMSENEFTATLVIDKVVYPPLELGRRYKLQVGHGLQATLEKALLGAVTEDKHFSGPEGREDEDLSTVMSVPREQTTFVIKYLGVSRGRLGKTRVSTLDLEMMSFEYEFDHMRVTTHLANYHSLDRPKYAYCAPPTVLGLTSNRYTLLVWHSNAHQCTISVMRSVEVHKVLHIKSHRAKQGSMKGWSPPAVIEEPASKEVPEVMNSGLMFCRVFSPRVYRWVLALAGFVMQFALGSVYGWSVFTTDITILFHGTNSRALSSPISFTLSIALLVIGVTACFGGQFNDKFGPRVTATVAGLLYGLGLTMAGVTLSSKSVVALYFTYGVIGGAGIGLGYVVPLGVLLPWFPDRRGFIVGLSVTGFGGGALILALLAPSILEAYGVQNAFVIFGIFYCVLVVGVAQFFERLPEGVLTPRWKFAAPLKKNRINRKHFSLSQAFRTRSFYLLWIALMLNICAGAAVISVAAPLAIEFCAVDTEQANWFVSTVAIFNGLGRVFWAWLSDTITRPLTFICLFAFQAIAFIMLINVDESSYGMLVVSGAIIGLCFGGGFGTMPAFVGDIFGDRRAGAIYGVMLTAWSAGGLIGPLLMSVMESRQAFYVLLSIMFLGGTISCVLWRDLKYQKLSAKMSASMAEVPTPTHCDKPTISIELVEVPKVSKAK